MAERVGISALRVLACLVIAALASFAPPSPAEAACGCQFGGVPQIRKTRMQGNDLAALEGHCVRPLGLVDVWVQQKIFHPRTSDLPPFDEEIRTTCVNDCRWVRIGEARADRRGFWKLEDLDSSFSTQLLTSAPAATEAYGVLTNIKVRSFQDNPGWEGWVEGPSAPRLDAFFVDWDEQEQSTAFLEARVSNARWMHVTIADGPDDGSGLSTNLDMDQDTPNFFLEQFDEGSVVNYARVPTCGWNASPACTDWLSLQAPSIHVTSPLIGRSSEYPFVLGMVTAMRPGHVLVATVRKGNRELSDIMIDVDMDVDMDVDVDVDVDIDLGFSFFSLF